jgi:hypothetical protein
MVGDPSEITVFQLPKFKAEATKLIGAGGIEAVAIYLSEHGGCRRRDAGSGRSAETALGGEGKG